MCLLALFLLICLFSRSSLFSSKCSCVVAKGWGDPRLIQDDKGPRILICRKFECSDRRDGSIEQPQVHSFLNSDPEVLAHTPKGALVLWQKGGGFLTHRAGVSSSVGQRVVSSTVSGISLSKQQKGLVEHQKHVYYARLAAFYELVTISKSWFPGARSAPALAFSDFPKFDEDYKGAPISAAV